MRLRTFTGKSIAEAMRAVRAEIGRDAVIMSTSSDPATGRFSVVAALDDSLLEPTPPPPAAPPAAEQEDEIARVLEFHRLPARLVRHVLRLAGGPECSDLADRLAVAFDSLFGFAELQPRQRNLMLVGPPGAGKTTTAAKIAARAVLQGQRVRLATVDTVRSGALVQLADLARVLETPCSLLTDPAELSRYIGEEAGTPVIVDSPGASPFDVDDLHRLHKFARAADAEIAVVLPAGMDPDDCADTARAFAAIGASKLVATRLDTTRRYGGLLAAAEAADLDLTDVSAAASIADALRPLNPCSLGRLLAAESGRSEAGKRQAIA